jgi:hypothetical protein
LDFSFFSIRLGQIPQRAVLLATQQLGGASLSSVLEANSTHIVTCVAVPAEQEESEGRLTRRTVKYLQAVAEGNKWIVSAQCM